MNRYIVFVHGFGVRADSNGLFSDIALRFSDYQTELIDLYDISQQYWKIPDLGTQAEKLRETIETIFSENAKATIVLICHSQGCVVGSLLPEELVGKLHKIIFLAPAIHKVNTKRFRHFFEKKSNVIIKDDYLKLKRKNGIILHITNSFADSLDEVSILDVYASLLKSKKLETIFALKDEHRKYADKEIIKLLKTGKFTEIEADHNFTGEGRKKLLKHLNALIK